MAVWSGYFSSSGGPAAYDPRQPRGITGGGGSLRFSAAAPKPARPVLREMVTRQSVYGMGSRMLGIGMGEEDDALMRGTPRRRGAARELLG